MRRVRIVACAVALLCLAGLTQPATADSTLVTTFQGVASVGKWFVDDCDKSGIATVTGRGLYHAGTQTIPGVSNGANTREEDGVWQFSTAGLSVVDTQSGFLGPFTLDLCGHLGPIVDFDANRETTAGLGGASCDNSKGHHGRGEMQFATGQELKLYDFGWIASAGGTYLLSGRYQEYEVATIKAEKYGLLAGLMQAQGGDDCLGLKNPQTNNGNGAQSLTVVGSFALLNTASIEPPHAQDHLPQVFEGDSCKDSGGQAGMDFDGKKRHDNKPASYECTDEDAGRKEPAPTPTPTPTPPVNQPPQSPALVAPSFAQSFPVGSPQIFTVRATDPEGDTYRGAVTVNVAGGGVAATFNTATVASGAESSGSPASPLGPGSYTWTAKSCDTPAGACSSDSSSGFFRVVATGNQAPLPPQLISPADGHLFPAGAAQAFTVRATDPDGDLYRGEGAVLNLSGVQVASFDTSYANSGSDSSGSPSPALPPGSYRWKARACDPLGSGGCGSWSSERAVSVASAVWQSALCDQSTVTDGWVSDVFLRLTSGSPQPREAWVCVRADYQSSFNRGGRVVLTHSDPAAILRPGVAAACEPFTGTPLLNGEVGDSSDPATWFTYRAVLKQSAGVDTVCVRATRAGAPILDQSIAVDAPGTGDLTANFLPDPTGVYPALEDPPRDPSRFSAECQLASSGKTRIVNAEFGGVPVWVYGQQSGSTTRLCVRAADGGGSGGRFLIDGGSPGAFPIIVEPAAAEPDAPGSPCGVNVWSNTDPVMVKVRRTATDADPVGFCLNLGGAKLRVLVDRSPGGTPPTVTWTPDSA